MKRCARRVVIAAAGLVAGLVGVLVVAHWDTVRDHVEAWWFQLTTETETVEPLVNEGDLITGGMQFLATLSKRSVILDSSNRAYLDLLKSDGTPLNSVLGFLREMGFRVIEQQFPRKAYVILYEECGHTSHVSSEGCRPGMPIVIDPSSPESAFLELELDTRRFGAPVIGSPQ